MKYNVWFYGIKILECKVIVKNYIVFVGMLEGVELKVVCWLCFKFDVCWEL